MKEIPCHSLGIVELLGHPGLVLLEPSREGGRELQQHLLQGPLEGRDEGLGEALPEGRGGVRGDLGGELLGGELAELLRVDRLGEGVAELRVGLGGPLVDVLLQDF